MRACPRCEGFSEGLSEGLSDSLLEGSEGLPKGFEGQPEGSQGPSEGSKGLPEESEGLPGGTGGGRTYGRTDGISPHSTGLRPLLGPLPKKGNSPLQNRIYQFLYSRPTLSAARGV